MSTPSDREIIRLRERTRKLAEEKSNLQLVVTLIENLNPLAGLDDIVHRMLISIMETIGGTNIMLYYWQEDVIRYWDFLGTTRWLAAIDDPMVALAAERREFVEREGGKDDTLLRGEVVPGSWTWAFPLLVGDQLIGVVKLENLHLSGASLRSFLPAFFSHAALILGNKSRELERQRALEALRESEESFRATFEQAAVGIAHVALDGRWLKVNRRLCDIVGYGRDELFGLTFQDITHPDDLQKDMALVRQVLGGEIESYVMEKRYIRKDGAVTWINLTVALVRDDAGRPDYFISIVEDINARKAMELKLQTSEGKFASAFHSAGTLMTISSIADGTYEEVNETFVRATGFTREEAVGRTSIELGFLSPENRRRLIGILREKGRIEGLELEVTRKDGTPLQCLYNGEVIEIAGQPKLLSVAQDISVQKSVEAKLTRAVETLTRSNTELERFAYVASHDLQEPLRTMTIYSQLLERRLVNLLDADTRDYLAFVTGAAQRMSTLIQDLLAYSRVVNREHSFAATKAAHVLDLAIENLSAVIAESGARVIAGPLPVVIGDELQLTQVFQNLLGNAIKFQKPGIPPEIRIAAERAGGKWVFSVADNGIGIERTYFDKIFDIFKRLHTHEAYPGTGIGLALCRRIVERHGGRIWVDGKPGRGCTFFFTLPASD